MYKFTLSRASILFIKTLSTTKNKRLTIAMYSTFEIYNRDVTREMYKRSMLWVHTKKMAGFASKSLSSVDPIPPADDT